MRWHATDHHGTAPDPAVAHQPDNAAMHQSATHRKRVDARAHDAEGRRRANNRSLQTLIELGRSVLEESEPETVLERVLESARELTGARYAALGVLDDRRIQLERFLTAGLTSRRDATSAIRRGATGRSVS